MAVHVKRTNVSAEEAARLQKLCPFGAIDYEDGCVSINAACKACKLCVKKDTDGIVEWQEEDVLAVDKSLWKGVCVYAQCVAGGLHPVTLELLGKARELASVSKEEVIAVLIGCGVGDAAETLLAYGADAVYVYDHPAFADFKITPYANAFDDLIEKVHPSSILVGATNIGRSLAPKVAARRKTGLTADCTVLEMKESGDLVQIRPAFGGNIMAQIVTPNSRPQFCTVRYKIFSAPERVEEPKGSIRMMTVTDEMTGGKTEIIDKKEKPKQIDISEADVIVACGRAFQNQGDLKMAEELASLLGAQLACTRPLVEAGLMDARRQIGLSGRTVKPKLIITLGISGSVQFAAGMKGAERIIAINADENASIFNIAHVNIVGDVYEIVPRLIKCIKEGKGNV